GASGQQDVGHEGVITGRDAFSLRSPPASLALARSRVSGQHDVGHEGFITGCDGFSLRSSIADPQGVTQPKRRSTYTHDICFSKMSPQISVISHKMQFTSSL
ncbi:hypothetical protein, partial [Lysinibacillus sp. NPDC093688]|uniref:hypothetical protein n=1 Tax=Lysinibacillus sp. NPDC093688 TaxID=3390577 RepID=UPI003CFEEF02